MILHLIAFHEHFSFSLEEFVIRLGVLNKTQTSGSDFSIEAFIIHENYNTQQQNDNDIAVIKLNKVVSFNRDITPACLWQTQEIDETSAVATGWGRTKNQKGSRPDALMLVQLDILGSDKCSYAKVRLSDSQICAGVIAGGHDTCDGGKNSSPIQIPLISLTFPS